MTTTAAERRDDDPAPASPAPLAPEPVYYRTDGPYRGRMPFFYDVEALPWARRVREEWRTIRRELEENVLRGTDQMVAVFNPAGPSVPGWRSVNFQTYLWRYHGARRAFPRTVALLESIPGLTSAFINLLEPHSAIPPHEGDSNTVVRCHLGLDVPAGDCALRAGPETRACASGRLLAFCDAHDHAAWNATDERRIVLVFDVMLPSYRRHERWICANVLSATAVIWLEGRLSRFRRRPSDELRKSGKTVPLPQWIRTALRRSIGAAVWLWLPIQRRLGRVA